MDDMQVELIVEQLMQQMACLGDKIITHRKRPTARTETNNGENSHKRIVTMVILKNQE